MNRKKAKKYFTCPVCFRETQEHWDGIYRSACISEIDKKTKVCSSCRKSKLPA